MCQRFKLSSSSKTLFSSLDGYEESFSLEETNLNQPALCLIKENGHYKVKYLTFGYSVLGKIVFNAKSETVAEKSLFKEDFRLRRALVPVTGFYEYDKNQIPHYFEEENKNRFYLAAIYHSSNFVLLTEKPEEAVSYYPFVLDTSSPLKDVKFKKPCSLVFGNEATGLPKEIHNENNIRIEQSDEVDSLNLTTSIAIGLYELKRQG